MLEVRDRCVTHVTSGSKRADRLRNPQLKTVAVLPMYLVQDV